MIVRGLVSLFCTRPPYPPPNPPVSHTTLSQNSFLYNNWFSSRLRIYPKVTFPHTIFFTDWSSLLPFSWLSLFLFHTYAAWKKLTCFWILRSFNLWNLRFSSLAPWVNRTCRRRFGWCHGLWDAEVWRVPSNDSNHPYKNRILRKKASMFGDTPFMETPKWRIQQFLSSDQSVKQCSGPFSQWLEPTASVGQLRARLVAVSLSTVPLGDLGAVRTWSTRSAHSTIDDFKVQCKTSQCVSQRPWRWSVPTWQELPLFPEDGPSGPLWLGDAPVTPLLI